jgi:hypothetical protein
VLGAGNSGTLVVSLKSAGALPAGNKHFLNDSDALAGSQTKTQKQ